MKVSIALLCLTVLPQDRPEVQALEKAVRAGDHVKAAELGTLGKDALPALTRLLEDRSLPDPARYFAANGLGETGVAAAVAPLLAALADESFNVRRCAAEALGRLRASAAIPRLRELAEKDPFVWKDQSGRRHWLVRESAAKALRALGEKPPDLPVEQLVPWQQPPIATGTPLSDTIPWERTVEDALARAAREQKPVLATVVAVGDSRWSSGFAGAAALVVNVDPHPFGDERAAQIDEGLVKERAMMATLFTDPDVVEVVRSRFVPVRLRVHTYAFDAATARPATDPLRKLGTSGLDCPPPALVFADAKGKLVHACRSMGVLHVPMARAMLRSVLERTGAVAPVEPEPKPSAALDGAWSALKQGRHQEAWRLLAGRPPEERDFEASFLRGLVAAKLGRSTESRAAFEAARAGSPKGAWGSRAAVCLQPSGIRLDEWASLVVPAFEPLATSTECTVSAEKLDAVVQDAVAFLLRQQGPDGLWGNCFVDPHPMAGPGSAYDLSVPRTALVVHALLKAAPLAPSLRNRLGHATARGIDAVGRFADAPEGHVWHLTYALHLQLELLRARHGDLAAARRRAGLLVARLAKEQKQGGWSYMPPPRIHSFNTAPVLLMLAELKRFDVTVPDQMIAGAVKLLEDLRSRDDAREFRDASSVDHRSVKASSCRSALCELALLEATGGRSTDRLRAAVELFFTHEPEVRGTRKIFESYFAVGPLHDAYHYYFGHYYTARALHRLPAADRKRLSARQRDVILSQVELDGSFVDAQMQGKSYSTAMALLTLLE